MKSSLLNSDQARTYALIFEKGDEPIASLEEFAQANHLDAAHFTAIGAFSEITLAFFSPEKMDYQPIPVKEQVEVLSFIGNITLSPDGVKVHAHAVVGLRDGTTRGGHVLDGRVWPTLEIIITEEPAYLRRQIDPETGLALVQLGS